MATTREDVYPGCALRVPAPVGSADPVPRFSASAGCWQLCGAVTAYTLARACEDPAFIHQLAVYTYTAQHAGGRSKTWPAFMPPGRMGALTVRDVLQAAPGGLRDARLREWGASVWADLRYEQPCAEALVASTQSSQVCTNLPPPVPFPSEGRGSPEAQPAGGG
jgi:hypothetical protein